MAKGKKYDNYTREELIDELETLKKKKYGLVWDRKNSQENLDAFVKWENMPENFVPKIFPVLKEVKDKEIITDKKTAPNLLIEGDNYHSLAVLNFTHKNAIDFIYIDPPYNTGNRDFAYNDSFVDKNDPWRHSKWLSFIEKRLILARTLLRASGVIAISIDDNECAQLRLLCDEIFGESNFVSALPRVTKKSGKQHSGDIASNHDYVLVYCRNKSEAKFKGMEMDERKYKLSDEFESTRGKYNLSQTLDYDSLYYNPAMDFPIEVSGFKDAFIPGGDFKKHKERHSGKHKQMDWVWRWSLKKFEFGLKNGFVVIKKGKGRQRIYTKTYSRANIVKDGQGYKIEYLSRENNLSSLALTDNIYSNDNAKKEIANILGNNVFEYPKPTSLIRTFLEIYDNKSALVLDFFAGSGTTGHAVLGLNAEDGGSRRFILCTNNENNIATDICYPRIKKVVQGYKATSGESVIGFGGNLKYFRNTFVASQPTDKNKRDLVNKSADMICVKEGVFNLLIDRGMDYKVFEKDGKYLGIVFNEDAIEKFITEANKLKGCFSIYCFSYGEFPPEKEFAESMENQYTIKPIPEVILKIYREIFKK